jgi:hypothetical protein
LPDPHIASTRTFCPADIPEASIPKSEMIRSTRPAGGKFQDAVISQERPGHVNTKADPGKRGADAKTPPLSAKPAPTASIAERLRERLKKGA